MGLSLGRDRAIATAVTGVSQALTLLGAALLGVLIARRFGSDAETDGFFFANAVYGIALFVGQSLRTTSAAALVENTPRNAPDLLAAVGWLAVLAGVLFAALGAFAVPLATSDLPASAQETARASLAILWPAAALQLLGGLIAALLATRTRYTAAASAYAVGALAGVVAFLALTPSAGVTGVPLALLCGTVVTCSYLAVAAQRRGGLPLGMPRLRGGLHRARQLLLGSASLVAAQLVVTSSVAFAATVGEGSATTYSYAVMAVSALLAGVISPVSVVFAPVVAASWDRTSAALAEAGVRAYRAGAIVIVPLVAGLLLLAPAPASRVLTALSQDALDEVFLVAFILSPALLTTLALTIPQLGILARQQFGALAAVSGGVVVLHIAVSAVVVALGGDLPWLAGVATLTGVLLAFATLALALGRETASAVRGIVVATIHFVVPGIVCFGVTVLALSPDGRFLPGAVAWLLGAAGLAAWLWLRRRQELQTLAAAVTRREP